MALIKCSECGNLVSDKAKACPNCGCPIEQENESGMACPECGQTVTPTDSVCPNCGYPINSQETTCEPTNSKSFHKDEEVGSKSKGWIYALLTILGIALIAGGLYYWHYQSTFKEGASVAKTGDEVPAGKYYIVVHNDNFGDFFDPQGRRICGVELRSKPDYDELDLSKKILILGKATNRLIVSNDRILADFSDYLSYTSSYKPNLDLGVPVEKQSSSNRNTYFFDLGDNQIEKINPSAIKHELTANNEFNIIVYDDKQGALYGPSGEYICGLKVVQMSEYKQIDFSKTITLYNESTDRIIVSDNGSVFMSLSDYLDDKLPLTTTSRYTKRKAVAQIKRDGDADIFAFSTVAETPREVKSSNQRNYTNSPSSGLTWTGATSEAELRQKLNGTYWHGQAKGILHQFHFLNGKIYYKTAIRGSWSEEYVYNTYKINFHRTNTMNFLAVEFGNEGGERMMYRERTLAFANKCMTVIQFQFGEPVCQMKYGEYVLNDDL